MSNWYIYNGSYRVKDIYVEEIILFYWKLIWKKKGGFDLEGVIDIRVMRYRVVYID